MRIEPSDFLDRLHLAIAAVHEAQADEDAWKDALVVVENLADSTASLDLPDETTDELWGAVKCIRRPIDIAGAARHLERARELAERDVAEDRLDPDDDGVVHK